MFHPAFLRRFLKLVVGLAPDSRLRAVWRTRHVSRCVSAAQPGEVLTEDDIQNPVQAILDSPAPTYDAAENLRAQMHRTYVIACLPLDFSIAFNLAFRPVQPSPDRESAARRDNAGPRSATRFRNRRYDGG